MEPIHYVVDPEGDTVLVLWNTYEPFAVWDPAKDYPSPIEPPKECGNENPKNIDSSASTKVAKSTAAPKEIPTEIAPSGVTDSTIGSQHEKASAENSTDAKTTEVMQVRYRVASKCLQLGSSYFRKLFRERRDTIERKDGMFIINLAGWNPSAIHVVMNIIHCQGKRVPTTIAIKNLAKVAVVVDYYGCHAAARFYALSWIRPVCNKDRPETYCRDAVLLLFASITFNWPAVFRHLTGVLIWHCRGPMQTLGLPIPNRIVEAIDNARTKRLHSIANGIESLKDRFALLAPCSVFECMVLRYGVFRVNIRYRNIHHKQIRNCTDGYSICDVLDAIKCLREPRWEGAVLRSCERRECKISDDAFFLRLITTTRIEGLNLSDFMDS